MATANVTDDFGDLLQHAVDKNRPVLERAAASPAAQTWLKPQLATPEGTQQVYGIMERLVSSPRFLGKLTAAREVKDGKQDASSPQHGCEVLRPEWWEPPAGSSCETEITQNFQEVRKEDAQPEEESLDSYVMIEKEDVLDAIGMFVAGYLAELPEAQSLEPKELQAAIKNAFKAFLIAWDSSLEQKYGKEADRAPSEKFSTYMQELRKSRMQQLWGWGRAIYRCVAFSYGAFSVYENPWLVRAVLASLWTASRLMFGLLV